MIKSINSIYSNASKNFIQKQNKNNSINNKTNNISFKGTKEVAAAKKIVHKYAAITGGVGAISSQIPAGDEGALFAIDLVMIKQISRIYNLSSSKEILSEITSGLIANVIGTKMFSKLITWIPGLGNIANAGVAAGITETVGQSFIKLCESGKLSK